MYLSNLTRYRVYIADTNKTTTKPGVGGWEKQKLISQEMLQSLCQASLDATEVALLPPCYVRLGNCNKLSIQTVDIQTRP